MKQCAKVLYVMDGDLNGMDTLKQVMVLAEEYRLNLTLFDVIDSLDRTARASIVFLDQHKLKLRAINKRLDLLEALVSMIKRRSCKLGARASFGNRATEIAREAAEGNYDLVIKSSERGLTDSRLLRKCTCPVWVLEPDDYTQCGQLKASNAPRSVANKENHASGVCMQQI